MLQAPADGHAVAVQTDPEHPIMASQEELLPELRAYVEAYPSGGYMIRHPLFDVVPFSSEGAGLVNDTYRWKTAAAQEARAARDYLGYLNLHVKSYRVVALLEIAPLVHGADYWELVAETWSMSEFVWPHRLRWYKLWLSKEPHREAAMSSEDRQYLAALPENLTIYRGVQHSDAIRGLSWTLSCELAQWFALRNVDEQWRPRVLKAEVPKSGIIAYFSDRQEDEILVHPHTTHRLSIKTDRVSAKILGSRSP